MPREKRYCDRCGEERPRSRPHCVACGHPLKYPNVEHAEDERKALDERVEQQRKRHARSARIEKALTDLLADIRVVMHRDGGAINALLKSRFDVLPTHLQNETNEIYTYRDDDPWEEVRRVASERLFPGYGKDLHFAALAPRGVGVEKFGPCRLEMSARMTYHRMTLFQENSARFIRRIMSATPQSPLPEGFRAVWEDRAKLIFAKIAETHEPDEHLGDLADLLLSQDGEEFVEANVYGPLSILSFEKIHGPRSEINRRMELTIQGFPTVQLTVVED